MLTGFAVFLVVVLLFSPRAAQGEEGGLQLYVPAVYGNLGMADLPPKGFYVLDFPVFADLDTPITTRGGNVHVDVDAKVAANAIVPLWLTDKKVFGMNYGAAFAIVPMYLGIDSSVEVPGLGVYKDQSDSNVGFGDVFAVPIALSKHGKNTFFLIYEGINVPLGEYTEGACCNLGLNHWAFDTNFGFTYKNDDKPIQFDSNIGFTFHTTNHATDYKSGSSVHWDYTVGYNYSERLQFGISGYVFQQVTGDSGSGAVLGDFKGEGVGIGPSVSYVINAHRPLVLQFEWIHDVHTKNRLSGDWVVFTIAARIPPLKQ